MLRRAVLMGLLAAALIPASADAAGYTVPADNPFVDVLGAKPEIYAYGLRNPFRWSFDRANGDVWIGDVGQNAREEIDHVTAAGLRGANFGWDCYEGDIAGDGLSTDPRCSPPPSPVVSPVYAYDTAPSPHAVTGGVVVRDPGVGSLDGQYVFGDFYDGNILASPVGDPLSPSSTGLHVDELVAFGQDASNHVYPVSLAGKVNRLDPGPTLTELPQSFSSPMFVTSPPGDTHRLAVVERRGDVQLLVDGVEQPAPFLDIRSQVSTGGEQGMSTIAFAPDYATSGLVYVYYTDTTGSIRVDQFKRSAADPNKVDPASQTSVITIAHPGETNHYGGQIFFGPDGYLYISTGDGGGANDPPNNAQNLGSLLGKVLRIAPITGLNGQSGSPPADRTPPTISISLRRRQRILRTHAIKLAVRVNEAASIAGTATVNVGHAARVLRFKRLTRTLPANKRETMRLRLSKRAFNLLRAALHHKRSFVAKLTISARDAAGNLSSKRTAVRLIR